MVSDAEADALLGRFVAEAMARNTIVPAQAPSAQDGVSLDPERRLRAAVLGDALCCLAHEGRSAGRHRREAGADRARAWIASDDRTWPYAFRNICDALGLEPDYVRTHLPAPGTRIPRGARIAHGARAVIQVVPKRGRAA
jgi:hypothetical protein